jgi:hypothetical protein
MTKMFVLTALAALTLMATSCGGASSYKPASQGAAYEIVVVADHDVWGGPAGDTVKAIFYRQFPMINRQETTFDVLRVLPGDFKNLVARHRNVLQARIDPSVEKPSISVAHNVYATSQIVLSAVAPDMASLTTLIDSSRGDILLALESAEKDRDVVAAKGHTPPQVAEAIKTTFGFDMATGPGYTVRDKGDDFLWLSYEMPTSSQGIVIYTYPFTDPSDFAQANLMRRRDEFVGRIPGEKPDSHMATNPEPGFSTMMSKKINGRQWAEMSGFWDVTGDFMGGPYRNYSTIDAVNKRVIAIDFYVYSPDPKLSQRNYISQLQHFLYTVDSL